MSEETTAPVAEGEALPEGGDTSPVGEAAASGDLQAVADAVDPVKAKAAAPDEDPEIDFGEGLKLRRSEAAKSLAKRRELDRAAFQKFEEASKIRKQMEALQGADPEEFFKLRGIDPTQYAIEKLQREVAMREATPEQRAALQREQELADREMRIKQQETEYQQRDYENQKQQYVQKLDKELPAALQKAGLAPDAFVFQQMASVLAAQIQNDMPEDYETAAEIVKESYTNSFRQHAATLKYEDAVRQYPEFVKVIREGDLARARNPQAVTQQKAPAAQRQSAPTPAKPDAEKFHNYFGDAFSALGIRRPG